MAQPLWKTDGSSSKKLNNESPHDPTTPLLGTCLKELKVGSQILVHPCSQQHYSKQSKCGSNSSAINSRMGKQLYVVYTYNGLSFSLKRRQILTQPTIWMNLEDFMLHEIKSDTKGQILYDSQTYEVLKSSQIHRDRKQKVARGWGKRETGVSI